MRQLSRVLLAAAALSLLAGCSTFNSLTGQTDNTVLPGKREEAIPGRAQFPEKQDVAVGSSASACTPMSQPGRTSKRGPGTGLKGAATCSFG